MTTLQELAQYCGVSMATVSRALRDVPVVAPETRSRVREAAERLGYVASPSAAGLASGRHRALAIAAPPLGPWFFAQAIRGVEATLHRYGYSFFLIDTAVQPDGSRRPFSRSSIEKRSDGVIALGIDLTAREREDLHKVGKPAVVVGAAVPDLQSIGIDDRAAARTAVRHLLGLGHRFIAHLGGDNDYGIENDVAAARRRAWAETLEEAGIQPHPSWFVSGHFTVQHAKQAALGLLSRPARPTAIFAASDEMAFGAILAAKDLHIDVPGELSVIGIDGHAWSSAFGLTTIEQDPFEQGGLAATLVLDALDGRRQPALALHAPTSFVRRTSTGPAPSSPSAATRDQGPVGP